MTIEEILDTLDDLLDKSWTLPLTNGRTIVDDEKIRDLLNDIRLNLPAEMKQARQIVADRAQILSDAHREADGIVRKAEDRARTMLAQDEITRQAKQRATEILTQANQKSKELRAASQEYSDDVLRQAEETFNRMLTEVRATRQMLRTPGKKQ